LIEKYGEILFGPMAPEKIEAGQRMLVMAEERRRASMEQFKADGLSPFMRPIEVTENPAIPDGNT
jgi:hypothetical protein